jgi:signal transduction histidine kinase
MGRVREVIQLLWAEPRVANPPRRVWRDWALVAVLVVAGVLEGIFRDDLSWRPVAVVLGVAPVFALVWRRTVPLAVVAVVFGVQTFADIAPLFGADHSAVLYTTGYVLLLPYALFRCASGRDAAIGLAAILAAHVFREAVNSTGIDILIGLPFFLLPAALGATVRYATSSRLREKDQIRLREREQLARELHDTVAHHVSAIAIQAQAGQALAVSQPAAATQVLAIIEEEASRTLAEMRTMVSALRHGEEPELVPQGRVADIHGLAQTAGDGPRVDVEMSGDLDHLTPSVEAAVYRIAQESITNARRHARHATRIDVRVTGENDSVRLTVRDDGDAGTFGTGSSSRYGLVGMVERATLLGGTLHAGPIAERGWMVDAVLPRSGAAR